MPGFEFDAATSDSEYSIAGRSVTINGKPYAGIPELTGGGIVKEGQTYTRKANGKIAFLSRGIKTPQDVTSKVTLGTYKQLKADLAAEALLQGLTDRDAYMDVKIVVTDTIASGDPFAPPWIETMVVSMLSWIADKNSDGSGMTNTIVWKQHDLPETA